MARYQLTFCSLLVLAGLLVGVNGQDCNTTFPDETACTPGPPHSMADSNDCTMFYLCYKGCVTHETCDNDWLFDDEINYCNLPGLVDCGERPCTDETHCPQPSTTTTTATTSTTTTTTTTSTTVPTTTTFTTTTITTSTTTVPTTTTFAPTTTTTMTTTTTTTTISSTTPNPTTTTTVSTTTSPIATTMTTTTTTTINTTTPPCDNRLPSGTNCPNSGEHGPKADPTDCTVFWMCEEGCAIEIQCVEGFLFDMGVKDCQESSTVDCATRPCTSEEHCPCVDQLPSSQQSVKCSATSGPTVDFYPDLEDCTSFFNCTEGCFTHHQCGYDYLYEIEPQWCNYNNKVECEARPCFDPDRCDGQSPPMTTTPITTTTSDPTITTTITTTTASQTTTTTSKCKTPCEESDFIGKIADISNCRKYWHCRDDGAQAHVRCPADWLYNSDSKECGQGVNCGDRPVCDDCGENCQHQRV